MANITAPLSDTAIANMAANTLDAQRITSLDDDTPFARFIAGEYGYVRDELLRLHPWAFAKKYGTRARDEVDPPFAWKYSYTLPMDCLRLLPLREGGALNGRPIKYERVGRKIYTNHIAPLPIIYICRVTNAADFDPLFARAFGQRLALIGSGRITGKEGYSSKAERLYLQALQDAFQSNALDSGTPEEQNRYDILDVRLGG